MDLPRKIQLVEVGPRDGLQNESQVLSADQKVSLIDQLSASGCTAIEIGSFVRPDRIPALADTDEVARKIKRFPGVAYSALVPNLKGLERALEAELKDIAVFMSATESHNQSNTNRSTAEALKSYERLVYEALKEGLRVRAYLSTVFGCPYEGKVAPETVAPLVKSLLDMGIYEVSLGDTIGVTHPLAVKQMLEHLFKTIEPDALALHFHDTRGTALANVYAGLEMGISTFDAALGGLGGCPYAPGAAGNVSSEDLLYMLHEMGIHTGVNLDALVPIYRQLQDWIGRPLMSKYPKTIQ